MSDLTCASKPGRNMVEPMKSAKISDKYCKNEDTFDALSPLPMQGEPFHVQIEKFLKPTDEKSSSEFEGSHESSCTTADTQKTIHVDSLAGMENDYEGSDEHDEPLLLKRDFSDFDLQIRAESKCNDGSILNQSDFFFTDPKNASKTTDHGANVVLTKLKRSCSNIERRITGRPSISTLKSLSYGDLKKMSRKSLVGNSFGIPNRDEEEDPSFSPISCASADKVMLRKKSSSKLLPSRSRKLWWKLFLWSHRNHHKSWNPVRENMFSVNENQNGGGYSSDTHDPNLFSDKEAEKFNMDKQWMNFPMEEASSPFDRVNAWVNNLEPVSVDNNNKDDDFDSQTHGLLDSVGSSYGGLSKMNQVRSNHHLSDEAVHANNILQSLHLNLLSSGAYVCGMGLKVLPIISSYSNLRSVNLSNNLIGNITAKNVC